MYQFIIFLQGYEADKIENEATEMFLHNDIDLYSAIGYLLSQWDYGDYSENPISENDFYSEIGEISRVYDFSNGYTLAYNSFLPTMALYKRL